MLDHLILLPALLLSGPGEPPAVPDSPAGLFPASSYGVVEFAGLEACTAAAAQQGLLGMAESLLRASQQIELDQLLAAQVVPQLDRELAEFGVTRADLGAVLQGRVALGVSRLTFFDDDVLPSLALAVEGGDVGQRVMRRFFDLIGANAPQAERLSRTVEGVQIDIVRAGRTNGAVAFTSLGGWSLLSSSPDYLADIVRTARGRLPSIGQAPEYTRSRGQQDPLLSVFANVGPFWDALQLVLPYEAQPILEALGVQRVEGLFLSLSMADNAGHDALRATVAHSEDGLVAALLPRGDLGAAARLCPPETILMATQTIDVQRLVAAGKRFIEALPGEARSELQDDVLGDLEYELAKQDLSPQQLLQFASQFGPNLTLAVSAPAAEAGGFNFPAISAYVDISGDGVVEQIVGLLSKMGAPLKQTEFQGHIIHYTSLPEGPGLSPSLVQVGQRLLLTSDVRQMKATLMRSADAGAPSLADQADFQGLQQRFGGAVSVQVLRIGHHLASYYDAFQPMIEGLLAQNDELNLTLEDLPTPQELRRVLADMVGAVSRDEGGVTLTSEGTVTLSSGLAIAGAVAHRVLASGTN